VLFHAQGVPVDELEDRLRDILIKEFGAKPKAAAAEAAPALVAA
jgi:hypothetical protein